MQYEEPQRLSRQEAKRLFEGGTDSDVRRALVSVAFYEKDLGVAIGHIFKCCSDKDGGIRATAIICVGHLARIHGTLPKAETVQVFRKALTDLDEVVRGHAQDALDDLTIYIPALADEIIKMT